jgi:hypothetical protein
MLRIFSPEKIWWLRPGLNPRFWVPDASMLTTRPLKPLCKWFDTNWSYDLNFHPLPYGITVSCGRYTMGFPVCYRRQKHHECKEGERSGWWWCVTLHIQTCSGRNHIIPLMWRPNTETALSMPVTLPHNQLLIRCMVTSPICAVTIRCYSTREHYKCVPTLGWLV